MYQAPRVWMGDLSIMALGHVNAMLGQSGFEALHGCAGGVGNLDKRKLTVQAGANRQVVGKTLCAGLQSLVC